MQCLDRISAQRHDPGAVPVVTLVHNERNILPDFLAHYRGICRPSFLIVDDRSTDGSREYLAEQPDVTLFRPVAGSTYQADKSRWRSELLDAHGADQWCLVPDLDEHFVCAGMPGRDLEGYIAALRAEGAEAVLTLMVDMYADAPLETHEHPEQSTLSLRDRFPLFDGPAPFPDGYQMRMVTARVGSRYPTPGVTLSGGARARLFYRSKAPVSDLQRRAAERFLRLDGRVTPRLTDRPGQWLARRLTRRVLDGTLNNTKLGLLRWRKGLRFNGGAHKLSGELVMSESIAVFLHYAFTRGRAGVEYIASRGQHADGARAYKALLSGDGLARSPVFQHSKRYDGVQSLAGLIRDIPKK